jgi:hypothetical protein
MCDDVAFQVYRSNCHSLKGTRVCIETPRDEIDWCSYTSYCVIGRDEWSQILHTTPSVRMWFDVACPLEYDAKQMMQRVGALHSMRGGEVRHKGFWCVCLCVCVCDEIHCTCFKAVSTVMLRVLFCAEFLRAT